MIETNVYILFHIHKDLEEPCTEEVKILGVYSSETTATEARERYKKLYGFDGYPEECFMIDKYEVDVDSNFTTGFVSWIEAT